MEQLFPGWDERPSGHKLSKLSLACECSTCTCARYYGKRQKRELEERISDDRMRDGLEELEEQNKTYFI